MLLSHQQQFLVISNKNAKDYAQPYLNQQRQLMKLQRKFTKKEMNHYMP